MSLLLESLMKINKKVPFLTLIYNEIINSKPRYKKIYHLIVNGIYQELFPTAVTLETSTICNLKCSFCPTGTNKSRLGNGTLKFNNAKKVIDEISNNIKFLFLSNKGEPFFCKDIFDIISYAKGKNMLVEFDTNLNYFNKEMASKLVISGPDFLRIALDGTSQKTYKKYRIKGNYYKVINNIRLINFFKKKLKSSKPYMIWQFVPFYWNIKEIKQAKRLAKELKMNFKIRLNHSDRMTPKKYSLKSHILHNKSSHENPCNRLEQNPVINWNGNMLGCCAIETQENHFGNVFEDGFYKTYFGKKMYLARKFVKNELNFIPNIICKKCSFYDTKSFIRN